MRRGDGGRGWGSGVPAADGSVLSVHSAPAGGALGQTPRCGDASVLVTKTDVRDRGGGGRSAGSGGLRGPGRGARGQGGGRRCRHKPALLLSSA